MTFDAQIQSITQDYIVPKITDDILQSNVLCIIFLAQAKPWFGESYKVPVKLSSSTQGGSFTDFDEFKTAGQNVRQNATFDPRGYYQSVVIGGIARSVNEISKTQLLNLVKVEMESVHQDMTNDIGTILYSDGTGNSNADFLGIAAGIDDGGNVATYGGLSRSAYPTWVSVEQTTVGAFDFSKQRTLHNSATIGGMKPTIDICNETVFGYIESDYQATVEGTYNVTGSNKQQLTMNGIVPQSTGGLVGQAGHDILYYAGTPIVKDDKSTAGFEWSINTNFYRWYGIKPAEANPVDLKSLYHDGNDYDKVPSSLGFGWTGFTKPAKQYAWIGQLLLLGNLFTSAPRLNSSSAGITS